MGTIKRCESVLEPCKNARPNCRDQNLILVKKSGNGKLGQKPNMIEICILNTDRSKRIKQSGT